MSSIGWVSIHRQIQDNPLWRADPFSRGQAWVDLILLANHKDSYMMVRGNRIDVKRGQVARSQEALAERWKWSRGKVSRFLKDLEIEQQIEQQKSNILSIVTIINYDKFQENHTTEVATDEASNKATNGQQAIRQTDTNNNKNNNIIIKNKYTHAHVREGIFLDEDLGGAESSVAQDGKADAESVNDGEVTSTGSVTDPAYSQEFTEFWDLYPDEKKQKQQKSEAYVRFCERVRDGYSASELVDFARALREASERGERTVWFIHQFLRQVKLLAEMREQLAFADVA